LHEAKAFVAHGCVTSWRWLLLIGGLLLGLYAIFVAVLILLGKRQEARALAGFIPDSLMLFKRLLTDRRVPLSSKVLLGAMVLYLAMPFDLVPDFIPVAGQLDDVILVAWVLRYSLKHAGNHLIEQQWPGPQESLGVVLRLVGKR
jgi:uncharacterized membrane protein YkvA (DUF1232 family)